MATKYWRLTTGGNFATATSWSLSSGGPANTTAPANGDTLIFDRASTYSMTLTASFSGPACTLIINGGSVTFSAGAYSFLIGTVTNNSTVTFYSGASGSAGFFEFNTFTNSGSCTFSGASAGVSHFSGYTAGGSFYNYGTLNITTTAGVNLISYGGSFYNYSGASTTVSGVGMYCTGNFINQGSLSYNASIFGLGVTNNAGFSGPPSSYNVQTSGATFNTNIFYVYSGTTVNNSTFTLLDSLTIGGTSGSLQFYAGYLNLNGQTVTCSQISVGSGSNYKGMIINGGTIYATGTVTFSNSAAANFTVTGTCYYITTNASAKTFSSGSNNGGWVYPWILLNSGGTLSVQGNYPVTFNGFQSSGSATITFTQGTTIYLSNPGKIGDGSNYLTLSGGTAANVSSIVWTGSGNPTGGLGALTISNISFGNLPDTNGSTPFIWKLGAGSTNAGGMSGGAFIDHSQDAYLLTNTGLTSWTLPSNWNPNNNQIYLIGGGGGGGGGVGTPTRHNGGGGGGGGYTLVSNYSGTAGSSVAITIGSGGSGGFSGPGSAGGSTTWASGAYVAGGGGGGSYSSGSGGSGGTGTYTGGTGGAVGTAGGSYVAGGAGGGGAAGPHGNGGNGSYNVSNNTGSGGGGGGGNGGGASASNATTATGAVGGNGWLGSGGGATSGISGTNGGGGGGGGTSSIQGGAGSEGTEILGVAGSAGGAGGSYSGITTNRSGTIGGGGGAGAASYVSNQTGGNGGQGLIVILNTYIASGTLLSTYCTGFDLYGTYADGAGGTYNALIAYNSATCGYAAAGGSSNFFNFF